MAFGYRFGATSAARIWQSRREISSSRTTPTASVVPFSDRIEHAKSFGRQQSRQLWRPLLVYVSRATPHLRRGREEDEQRHLKSTMTRQLEIEQLRVITIAVFYRERPNGVC